VDDVRMCGRRRTNGAFSLSLFRSFDVSLFRCFGVAVFRSFGVSVLRCCGVAVFRCCGVSVFRCFGVAVFRCFGGVLASAALLCVFVCLLVCSCLYVVVCVSVCVCVFDVFLHELLWPLVCHRSLRTFDLLLRAECLWIFLLRHWKREQASEFDRY